MPRLPEGTPAQGVPRFGGGASRTRGGHPEQREAGGGWGEVRGAADGGAGAGPGSPTGPAAASGARKGAGGVDHAQAALLRQEVESLALR
ncbi:hypothetical protein ACWES4_35270, partial [Streptomyces sp. NPDC004011]